MVETGWGGSSGHMPAGDMPGWGGSSGHMPAGQAEPQRRFGAFILEQVLFLVTLGIGYVVWLVVVMSRGQTPGKQVLGLVVVNPDGTPFNWGKMLLRLLFQGVFWTWTFGIGFIVDAILLLTDKDGSWLSIGSGGQESGHSPIESMITSVRFLLYLGVVVNEETDMAEFMT